MRALPTLLITAGLYFSCTSHPNDLDANVPPSETVASTDTVSFQSSDIATFNWSQEAQKHDITFHPHTSNGGFLDLQKKNSLRDNNHSLSIGSGSMVQLDSSGNAESYFFAINTAGNFGFSNSFFTSEDSKGEGGKVTLLNNLGAKVELKFTPQGVGDHVSLYTLNGTAPQPSSSQGYSSQSSGYSLDFSLGGSVGYQSGSGPSLSSDAGVSWSYSSSTTATIPDVEISNEYGQNEHRNQTRWVYEINNDIPVTSGGSSGCANAFDMSAVTTVATSALQTTNAWVWQASPDVFEQSDSLDVRVDVKVRLSGLALLSYPYRAFTTVPGQVCSPVNCGCETNYFGYSQEGKPRQGFQTQHHDYSDFNNHYTLEKTFYFRLGRPSLPNV